MWKSRDHYNLVATKCPVCPTRFGGRNPDTVFAAHCDECRATFTWQPGEDKPKAVLDSHKKPRYCDRHGCHCR